NASTIVQYDTGIDGSLANSDNLAHSDGASLPDGIGGSRGTVATNELSYDSVFIISTADEAGIQRNAMKLCQHLQSLSAKSPFSPAEESQYLNDLAYTLARKRSMFK